MTIAIDHANTRVHAAASPRATVIAIAGFLSLGAGAIHAAAIGVHAEHRPAALAFTLVAALQIGWGGLALVRSGRVVSLSGAVLGVGAFAGWVVAKTSGIGFVEGLDVAEPIQTVDALAAGLAVGTVVLLAVALRCSASPTFGDRPRVLLPLAAVGVVAITTYGMAAAGTHVHSHGTTVATTVETSGAVHDHDHGAAAAPTPDQPSAAGAAGAPADHHDHAAAAVAPVAYDPTKPIDLGGVEGVTPEQQAAAENEVALTIMRLPKWADYKVAEAAGFHSIGDGLTGTEHFINQAFINDDIILDPDKPESLVYSTKGGGRTLVAAMYMVKPGTPIGDVPNIGGKLMQWHTHGNLCYKPDGKLGGLTNAEGKCAAGLILPVPTPMIHVWIRKHPCGPFAALEGIGAGTIAEGETKLCDTAHGAH